MNEQVVSHGSDDDPNTVDVFVAQRGELILSIGADAAFKTAKNLPDADEAKSPSFFNLSESWLQSVLGFLEAFPIMGAVAHVVHLHQASDKLVPMLEKICTQYTDDPKTDEGISVRTYKIGKEHFYRVNQRIDVLNRYKRAEKSFLRAQILAIVSEYEAFVCDLLRIIITKQPEAFIAKESTVLASEVIRAEDLSAVRQRLIEDRIESIQRESHVDQLKFIYDQLKIPHPDAESLRDFAKICEARNILTHADGKINRQYIAKLKKLGFLEADLPKIGDELFIDDRFIKRSAARVFLTGFFTLHIVWQHLEKQEADKSILLLIDCSHDLLVAGFTKLAAKVCRFILAPKSPAKEIDRAYAIINLALSVRLDNKIDEKDKSSDIEAILSARDWTIVNPLFKLALACVRGETDNLATLIDHAVADGLKRNAFMTWALFQNVRQTDVFRERIKHHFGIEIDVDSGTEEDSSTQQRKAGAALLGLPEEKLLHDSHK